MLCAEDVIEYDLATNQAISQGNNFDADDIAVIDLTPETVSSSVVLSDDISLSACLSTYDGDERVSDNSVGRCKFKIQYSPSNTPYWIPVCAVNMEPFVGQKFKTRS